MQPNDYGHGKFDYLGTPMMEGDEVVFPSSGIFMDATIIRFRDCSYGTKESKVEYTEAFVESESGARKWKNVNALIRKG